MCVSEWVSESNSVEIIFGYLNVTINCADFNLAILENLCVSVYYI